MEPESPATAWLQCSGGETKPIGDSFLIGRSAECQVLLKDAKVSRRHCMIHRQGALEFWLVDLQSANGTRLNGRRISQASRLRHGDTIELAGYQFRFHQPGVQGGPVPNAATVTMTIQEIRNSSCWLLVGDLVDSTGNLSHLGPEAAAGLTGHWLAECRKVIEARRGTINKYLGDGFLAYWIDGPGIEAEVQSALQALKQLQQETKPPFRMVLHYGAIVLGGAPTLGEESLAGREVNFAFRMEDLASRLGISALLSEPALQRLQPDKFAPLQRAHPLQGFEGEYKFFRF